jgi:hypothetical protein
MSSFVLDDNFEVIKEKPIKSTWTKPQLQVLKTCSSTKKFWETKKGKDYVKFHKINISVKALKKKVSNTTLVFPSSTYI